MKATKTTNHFNGLFDGLFDDIFKGFLDSPGFGMSRNFVSSYNIGIEHKTNDDGSLAINFDVPGIKEEDIIVEHYNNLITVKGERKTDVSSFSLARSYSVPAGFDVEGAKASLNDGVLTLTLAAKALPPASEVKRIPVTTNK